MDPEPADLSELPEVPDDLLLPELLPELPTDDLCEERCTPVDWDDSDLLLWPADCEVEDCLEGLVAAGCLCVAVPEVCLAGLAEDCLLSVVVPVDCREVPVDAGCL